MASVFCLCVLCVTLLFQLFKFGICGYCTNSLALSSCPDLPTYDQISLSAYGGKWYEIGSTANFKNIFEAGGVCAEAQYTVESPSKLKVVNTNLITATPRATFSVREIAVSSALVCTQARAICSQLNVNDSFLEQGLSKVRQVKSEIDSKYPEEAALVSTAASKIQQASADLGLKIDHLTDNVTQLQSANSLLSQTDGDASSVVASLKSTIYLAKAQVTSIESSIGAISDAQRDLLDVAKSLFRKGVAALGSSLALTAAATEVLVGAKTIQSQVGGMSISLAASAKAAEAVLKDTTKPSYNLSTISGTASVNETSPGKLSVVFDPLPGKLFPGKYWILAVDEDSSKEYNAALVYSCDDVITGGADQTLWILGRNPTLSEDVITKFLNLASSMGIYQDCDAPFVLTVRSPKCTS